jgi:hypothetical protein
MPQGTSATDGHINVGTTVFNYAMFGTLGLIARSSRTDGKITIT